jgi:4-oxalocrotonate tautomerase
MPFVRITAAVETLAPAQVEALQAQTTALLDRCLGKRREVTVVAVQASQPSSWAVDGRTLADGAICAQVDIAITAGTNKAEEKASFLAAMHRLLVDVLGEPAAPVYLMIHEIAAGHWGYDGRTQASRRPAVGPA